MPLVSSPGAATAVDPTDLAGDVDGSGSPRVVEALADELPPLRVSRI